MFLVHVWLQALTFNQFISNICQGIQDIMGIVNRPGAQHQLKIANCIFGAMNFGFPFVSATACALGRGEEGKGSAGETEGCGQTKHLGMPHVEPGQ